MSPWPAGLDLPDLDTRPTCTALWPPLLADDSAKAVGKWTIVTRSDGKKQWAFDGYPLYTSSLDHGAGDVNGSPHASGDSGAMRQPIAPKPDIPAQFKIQTMPTGRMLTLTDGYSVYTYDKDPANKSTCDEMCQRTWKPVLAAVTAPQARGEWVVIERSPGKIGRAHV